MDDRRTVGGGEPSFLMKPRTDCLPLDKTGSSRAATGAFMPNVRFLIEQIQFARSYTLRFLDEIDPSDWFRMPSEGVTHVAWQVGHLAVAEYRLALSRIRGVRPEDEDLIPERFLTLYSRDSRAEPDPAKNPHIGELRGVFDRVHQAAIGELSSNPDLDLDAAILQPHLLCTTKGEILRWCSHHEMIHAGQIALLRRLFGAKPLW
jgi:uncharacterized damage-inducible protein DinB